MTTARVQGVVGESGVIVPVVDSIGVGGGVVDRLRELAVPVLAYTGAAKTRARTREGEFGFTNVRSAAYWRMRELLDPAYDSEVMLPPNDLLISDLTAPTWTHTTGRPPLIQLEKKEDLIKRLGRSPDNGDAVVMAAWAENLAAASVQSPASRNRTGRSAAGSRYGRTIGTGGT
ncbi:hypothetical protein VSR01_16295 [Actinacidiphila sp. DG2A-62]|uniref:hypothetical protein n=1 Tax=Actinacidiphila sp. DG2A-62 TaxID=3108821 RepID=UPI002DBAB910|nr:hypothetical protein [Actinacidiphila sp. DG2A-62]MEC3995006.1 hypothetical protein [Actinacidiphila sp. DG2A-62]